MEQNLVVPLAIAVIVLMILSSAIRILREYERGVIFRLGRLIGGDGLKGPGLILLIPVIDKMVKVSSAHSSIGCTATGCHYFG
jgi:regulator of protease activity HflC (stomatin/prohibitin superfamily)